MRIIAGTAKGRRLVTPSRGTRPLTGRAREALFSILGDSVRGAMVLDLYAGSGSFGLEALSRGADDAIFVERGSDAVAALRANIDAVGLGGRAVAGDVVGYLADDTGEYDLVFVDPPYAQPDDEVGAVLRAVADRLAPTARVVVHRRAGGAQPGADNLRLTDRRRYGDNELWLYVKEGA